MAFKAEDSRHIPHCRCHFVTIDEAANECRQTAGTTGLLDGQELNYSYLFRKYQWWLSRAGFLYSLTAARIGSDIVGVGFRQDWLPD